MFKFRQTRAKLLCVLRAQCSFVAFRKDSRLKELSSAEYINFNYKTILKKKLSVAPN